MTNKHRTIAPRPVLTKSPTGIRGLDEITGGGLPSGRTTLLCGGPGSGKTMLAVEFLIRGAIELNEPGVFMMFEENIAELTANVRSLGFDLDTLSAEGKVALDYVHVERSEIEETGEYDLEALFIRLGYAIESIGAKRVVLDTIEALFAGLPNHGVLRAELRRLFRWLKDRGITAVVTAERGDGMLTRFGLEEYVADCVIVLDHRVDEQISTRRLRVVKYRGTSHGTNEYPFLIGDRGFSVFPITSLTLTHQASTVRVSTGIARLDEMLGGEGLYQGSSVLVSGTAGTGKSSIGATLVDARCRRGERCLLFAYEESPSQIVRNMRSIGIDLDKWMRSGLLQIHSSRPTLYGLERHLVAMHDLITTFEPALVVVDPVSNFTLARGDATVKAMLMRLIDVLKQCAITAVFTILTAAGAETEESQVGISSLMDAWLRLSNDEYNGERNRTLAVLKARGMPHSNQVREFVLGHDGIHLVDAYLGAHRVLTGTARLAQEADDREALAVRGREQNARARSATSRRRALEAQIAALQAEMDAEVAELDLDLADEASRSGASDRSMRAIATRRGGATNGVGIDEPRANAHRKRGKTS